LSVEDSFLRRNFVWIVGLRYKPNRRFQLKTVWPQNGGRRWQMAALRVQLTVVKIYGCIGGNQLLKKITLNKEKSKQFVVWKFTTLFKVQAFEHLTAFFVSKCFDHHSNISRKLQKTADIVFINTFLMP
jgi:hypothetical protein